MIPWLCFCSWVPRGCHNWRDRSWKATTPRALQREHTEMPQSFCERGLLAILREGFHSGNIQGLWRGSQGTQTGNTIFGLCLGLTTAHQYLPQKGASVLSWSPNVVDCCTGTPPDHLAPEASRSSLYNSIGLNMFAFFKSCCL